MMDALEIAYLRKVEAENEQLRDRVAQLEELVLDKGFTDRLPIELELTTHEAALVGFLMKHPEASKERLLTAIYGHRPDADEPEINIIDVFVCRVRKKLRRFPMNADGKTLADGLTTLWGRGFALSVEAKVAIRALALPKTEDVAA